MNSRAATRSKALAIGRLDGTGDIKRLSSSDIAFILECIRYQGESLAENGNATTTHKRVIRLLAELYQADPTQWTRDL